VFVKGYKSGLMKDFLDLLDTDPKLVMILVSSRLLFSGIQASAVLLKFKVLDTRLIIS